MEFEHAVIGSGGDAGAIIETAQRAVQIQQLPGSPAGLVVVNGNVVDLRHMVQIDRVVAVRKANTAEAFVKLVQQTAGGEAAIFADVDQLAFGAVVDWSTGEKPTREEHRIVFKPEPDPGWVEWGQMHDKPVEQIAFADFLEEHLDSIVDPPGADLLELVQDIKGHKNVTFQSAHRLATGETKIQFVEDVATRSAHGDLTIPATITIQTPIFRGTAPVTIDAFLRYRITTDGKLVFTVKLKNMHDIVPDAFDELRLVIATGIGEPPLEGWHS